MAAAAMWIDSSAFAGPLSNVAGGSDFSVFTGIIAGGLIYWLLGRNMVAKETRSLAATTPQTLTAAVPSRA